MTAPGDAVHVGVGVSLRALRLPWVVLALAACEGASPPPSDAGSDAAPPPGGARFGVEAGRGFFDAPFPDPLRLRDDGTLAVRDVPNPTGNVIFGRLLDALETLPSGYAANAAVLFPFDLPLDPSTFASERVDAALDAPFQLVDVDASSPSRGRRVPLRVAFKSAAETYTPPNVLVLLPEPGFVLRPRTQYAAIVLDTVRDAWGRPLVTPEALGRLLAGHAPAGANGAQLVAEFGPLRDQLARDHIDVARVRAATTFRTGDPYAAMDRLRDAVAARPAPPARDLRLLRTEDTYCLVEGRVALPLFQDGARPYTNEGGAIRFDAAGAPVVTGEETVRFALSVPRRAPPLAGFPLLFYAAGQGGAYTQFVDRGPMAEEGRVTGRGPAWYLADVGVAALSIEAPLVGPRHPTGSVDGTDFFNVQNPVAFRDNVRQAAADFTSLLRMTESLTLPASLCPGVSAEPVRFDASRRMFWGHSTGATIGAVVLGAEPDLRAGVLSGAGGSWLYNLTIKREPIDFATAVRLLLGYRGDDRADVFDLALNLAQTFWDPIEPMNWAGRWALSPRTGHTARDILVIEGVEDGYFPPPSVNALALAAGADALLPTVEATLASALARVGRGGRSAPLRANVNVGAEMVTLAVAQHAQPPGISGHYVPFELPGARYQYRCFAASAARGRAVVAAPASDAFAPCP